MIERPAAWVYLLPDQTLDVGYFSLDLEEVATGSVGSLFPQLPHFLLKLQHPRPIHCPMKLSPPFHKGHLRAAEVVIDLLEAHPYVAPLDVQFSEFDVVQPDVVVVLNPNAQIKTPVRIIGAPDLVVEVISPSSGVRDRVDKAALYVRNGVREYWLVDPKTRMLIIQRWEHDRLVRNEYPAGLVRSALLDGFEIDLARLFRRPPGERA